MAVPLIPIGYAVISGVGRHAATKTPQLLRNYMLKESSQIFAKDNPDEETTEWQDKISKEKDDKETQKERYRALERQDGTSNNKGNHTDPRKHEPNKSWKDKILDERSQVEPNNLIRKNPLDEVQVFETASLESFHANEDQLLGMLNEGYTGFSNDNYEQDFTLDYDYADSSDSSSDGGDGSADGGGDGGE